jgi:outer membrane protein assembly factor BamB
MIRSRFSLPPVPRWIFLPALGLLLAACSPGATGPTNWPAVGAGEDRVFVAHGSGVYAVDLEGDELWRYPREPSRDLTFFAAPTVAEDGTIYAVAYQGLVVALEADTGDLAWEFATTGGDNGEADGRIIASPAIAGDLLLVPTDGGTLFFLDRNSGELLRTFEDGGQLWSTPRIDGENAYLASLAHTLYAIELATGDTLWTANLGYAIADSPTLEDGMLLSGILGDALIVLDAQDGSELWRAPSQGWVWGSPAVADGRAVFGDVSGTVYALDLASREMLWQETPGESITTSPVIVDGRVVLGFENGSLIAYNLETRAVDWDETAAGPILSDPVVAGDLVIVAVTSKDVLLQAFDAVSGDPAWDYLPATGD